MRIYHIVTLTHDECEDMILTAVILVNINEIVGLSWQNPYIASNHEDKYSVALTLPKDKDCLFVLIHDADYLRCCG